MDVVITMIVENVPGVLDRISGIFRRYGWNMDSVSAGEIKPGYSQMDFVLSGKNVDTPVLAKKLNDLEFVVSWQECTDQTHVIREMILFKLKQADFDALGFAGARVVETNEDMVVAEATGTMEQIGALRGRLEPIAVEIVCSGAIGISKGEGEK